MLAFMDQKHEPIIADEAESTIAGEAARRLKSFAEQGRDVKVHFDADVIVPLPARAVVMFHHMLESMANRVPVSLIPHDAVLTTRQAADYLNVSRPYLIKKIDEGDITHTKVGSHRRIKFGELKAYEQKVREKQEEAMRTLNEEAKKLNLE